MKRELSEREKWFVDRIGKVVYRNTICPCEGCKSVYENGLLIQDEDQALYAYDNETELTAEGDYLRYFDTKEEVAEFEKEILNAAIKHKDP